MKKTIYGIALLLVCLVGLSVTALFLSSGRFNGFENALLWCVGIGFVMLVVIMIRALISEP